MKTYLQVKEFSDVTSDNTSECNEFMKEIGCRFESVNSFYNTILGGVVYVVLYHA